jgi:aspartate aminotransferase
MTDTDFCMRLLEEHGVSTVPGSAFGAPGFFRISYAASTEALQKGCARIAEFCSKLRSS